MSATSLGTGAPLDLDVLLDTRLLLQANSGGGKSWALRRLLEQTHGRVQHLVIDPEGEFSTLRERFDYVLAARQHGDTIADPRSAKLLAERLLELRVSAILDIYELKAHERIRFVRLFLEALVDAPKRLWHPALIVVDEAHVYAPQAGEAESAGAVIDLATRGRKRGFCAVLATQRLSKLHKDAAAELNNKLIGRTGLDVDVKRAADELGFGKDRWRELRELPAGDFFAFGPALTPEVQRIRVGGVATSHPKAGARIAFTPPPPTAKVKALLPKLADLPAEAEERARDLADLHKELAVTRRQLTLAQRGAPTAPAKERLVEKRVEVPMLKDGQIARLEKVSERLAGVGAEVGIVGRELAQVLAKIGGNGRHAVTPSLSRPTSVATALSAPSVARNVAPRVARHLARPRPQPEGGYSLRKGARRMLEALARRFPAPTTQAQVAQLAGLARSGGTFSTYLSDLRRGGFITERGDLVELAEAGWEAIGQDPGSLSPQTTDEVLGLYAGVLRAGAKRMLDELMAAYPGGLTREELASRSDVVASGGTFNTYLSDLRRSGLVEEADGEVRASELLMDPTVATTEGR